MVYESQTGEFTMALAGELMPTRAFAQFREPSYLALAELMRSTDVTFAQAEMLFHDYEGVPCESIWGTHMRCDPRHLADLKWIGINMIATASNHAFDYMETGVLVNKANLDRHGLVNAGTGRNLTLARAPAYFDSLRGRVALVSLTDHVNVPAARAGEERPEIKGRPGANTIRITPVQTLDRDSFEQLRRLDERIGFRHARDERRSDWFPPKLYLENEREFFFTDFDVAGWPSVALPMFRLADKIGRTTIADADDWAENLKWIKDARRMADWVILSFHCGYQGATADDPGEHMVALAHDAIDNGVDIVVGTGLHRDKGIEIYKGKPILYGLGNFLLQNETPAYQPADGYAHYGLGSNNTPADYYYTRNRNQTVGQVVLTDKWQSAVAIVRWKDRNVAGIELHPISLGMGLSVGQRGRPVLADESVCRDVFDRFVRCSKRFGTDLRMSQNGVIELTL